MTFQWVSQANTTKSCNVKFFHDKKEFLVEDGSKGFIGRAYLFPINHYVKIEAAISYQKKIYTMENNTALPNTLENRFFLHYDKSGHISSQYLSNDNAQTIDPIPLVCSFFEHLTGKKIKMIE